MVLGLWLIPLALFVAFLLLIRHESHRGKKAWLTDWPVFGTMPGFLCNLPNILDFATEILNQNGGTFVLKGPWFANADFLVTSDPVNVNYVLTKNFANYPKGKPVLEIFEVLGHGILNADNELWKYQRRAIHSLVKNNRFELYLKDITRRKVEKGLCSVLEHVSEQQIFVDLQDVFQRLTFDVYWLLVLGQDPNCLSVGFPKHKYEKAFDHLGEAVFFRNTVPQSFWKLQKWLQIGKEKKCTEARETFDNFLFDCISKKQETLKRIKAQPHTEVDLEADLLTTFMAAIEEEEQVKDDSEQLAALKKTKQFLRDMATNLLVAGRDTVSASLTWFFWLLSTHPSVENKILEEIEENIVESDRAWEDLNKLVYLQAALSETLRLYPPVPINRKTAIMEDTLPSGHKVSRNAYILLGFYAMGRNKEMWGEDCLEFKPERWISEGGSFVRAPCYKFTTFNAGPRTCLGKDITFMQMKMVAAAVLPKYQIQVAKDHPVSPSNSITLFTKHGLKVRISKRVAS